MNKDAKLDVTVTTQVRLTLKGQTFDLTMEELRELHVQIGKVVGAAPTSPDFLEMMRKIKEEGSKARPKERPFYPPPPYDHPQPWLPYQGPQCFLIADTPPDRIYSGGSVLS